MKITFFFSLLLLINVLIIRCDFFQDEDFSITPFEALNRVDTIYNNGVANIYKIDNYLLSGYVNSYEIEKKIDHFACLNKDTSLTIYAECFIYFYRKSQKTNNNYVKSHPKEFFRHYQIKDCLYEYKWRDSKFFHKGKRRGSAIEFVKGFNCD